MPELVIQTDRLNLRKLTLDDAGFIVQLVNSPGWLEFIGDRNIKTLEAAEEYLTTGPVKSYQENGFGLWMVELKSGEPIGMCGLLKRDTLEHPDIGFAFMPEYMGKGYAYEAAAATIAYAKEQLNLSEIAAITIPGNVRSIKLLEKIGMKCTRQIEHNNDALLLYST
jgi:RimJ/RimL family protein N-acetyltransferase